MNRRNFINGLLSAVAGFSILPPAETYGRRVTKPEAVCLGDGLTADTSVLILLQPWPLIGSIVTSSGFQHPGFNGEWLHVGGGKCIKWPRYDPELGFVG
ncbi:MAG: hypothetical protein DMF06_08790 [Verrucomicrobia bacterium]|nr:MAG: hypothetical protein DMF06_08790 [Verrucomicrobiota bacterium]